MKFIYKSYYGTDFVIVEILILILKHLFRKKSNASTLMNYMVN